MTTLQHQRLLFYWDESADNFKLQTDVTEGVEENAGIITAGTTATLVANLVGNVDGQVDDISNFTTDNLSEAAQNPTNKYFTDARARAAFSNGTGVSIANDGEISIGQSVATNADVTFATVGALSLIHI